MVDGKPFLLRHVEMLTFLCIVLGLYDFLCALPSALVLTDNQQIASLLIVRYCALLPALLLTRQIIVTAGGRNGSSAQMASGRVYTFSFVLIAIPTASLIAQIFLVGDDVRPCPLLAVTPCSASTTLITQDLIQSSEHSCAPPAPPVQAPLDMSPPTLQPGENLTADRVSPLGTPPAVPPLAPSRQIPAEMCALGGAAAGYCLMGYHADYVSTHNDSDPGTQRSATSESPHLIRS